MNPRSNKERNTVVLFDIDTEGHHAGYLIHLVREFSEMESDGTLVIASVPQMLEAHNDLAQVIDETPRVLFHEVHPEYPRIAPAQLRLPIKAVAEWEALNCVCRAERATHAVLMYADAYLQVPIALGLPVPCDISGIYFRPIFHYDTVSPLPITKAEEHRGRRQQRLLRRAMRHPKLSTVFSLDSFAVHGLNALGKTSKARWLPDPIDANSDTPPQVIRDELGVRENDTLLLLFGVLSSRKGVRQVLDAMRLLPADVRCNTVLSLVGPVHPSVKTDIEEARSALGGSLKIRDEFVSESDVQSFFAAADIVLAPYPRHVGMSAIVIRAAAAGTPLISSAFGLMGALVKHHRLGLCVDAREPAAIAEAILDLINAPSRYASPTEMQKLATAHHPKLFARAILTEAFSGSIR